MSKPVKKTWLPTVAGILTIVCGATGLLRGIAPMRFNINLWEAFFTPPGIDPLKYPLALLSILALYGGSYILQRRMWWLGLASAVCGIFGWWHLAIPAIILVILSRKEFE